MIPTQPQNKEQRDWLKACHEMGYPVVHHATARTMGIKGIGNIGHYFLCPVTEEEHDWLHGKNGIAGKERKPWEKERFDFAWTFYIDQHGEEPFSAEIYHAIMNFRM